ncbi:hypothetical protein BOX15_Mlig004120g3 [Macrostomum lignano]|uniref:6-phosphofructokinase n=2 Tax=Macrostomum lignano TaxID=282301 RepID=A0A267GLV5_9PLAT|nr:hypothetical protein BOX15_Mlig004120g3 [Macrostomum lignano]
MAGSLFVHASGSRRSSFEVGGCTETLLRMLPQGERPALAVLTSGGDSQGMNPAIRATVRMGIYCGFRVYLVYEGYEGMIGDGEPPLNREMIREATWASVSNVTQLGGTIIGSARSARFRTREGRLLAARNLVRRGINNLVVIGGDGSLTGADLFRREWPALLEDLHRSGAITERQRMDYGLLHIAGMVGSIDNDFCGTDMTIGTDSALHRIMEACDAIVTTAQSHQRAFVMEVMGRHCGYLALVSALCCEADFLFIPEEPPAPDWPDVMCNHLSKARTQGGKRLNIVIVAEGAIDKEGSPISAASVRDAIVQRLNYDTRITVLGHVQRGGAPSAFDRLLGCRMAAEAVLALVDARADPDLPSTVVSLEANQAVRLNLMDCVQRTKAVNEAIMAKEYARSVELRGKSFQNNLITYRTLKKLHSPAASLQSRTASPTLLVVMVGAPACGANACIRSFVRTGISNGFRVLGVNGSFEGLARGNIRQLTWECVTGLTATGGSFLGTKRATAAEVGLDKISDALAKVGNLSGILLIGGFEAYTSMVQLHESRLTYPVFGIPLLLAPCTISNNVPGTDFSIGADTALNEIAQIIDKLKQSAVGTQRRVFVVETMGGNCGYLATLAGLAGGADAAYITEDKFDLSVLLDDVRHLKKKMADGSAQQIGLILRNENANENYSTDFVYRVFKEEGKGVFDCRSNVLGHMQQGGTPSPYDRNLATKFGVKSADWFLRAHSAATAAATKNSTDGEVVGDAADCGDDIDSLSVDSHLARAGIIGITRRGTAIRPLSELLPVTDFKLRMPRADTQWWLRLRPLLRILAKHESVYESDSVPRTLSEQSFVSDDQVWITLG